MADRREQQVRRLMDGPHPRLPPDLARAAVRQGGRVLRRRRLARHIGLLLGLAAIVLFTVWAVNTQPWQTEPAPVLPPGIGW